MLKDIIKTRAGATVAGLLIAILLFFMPEAKSIACGSVFTLPLLFGE